MNSQIGIIWKLFIKNKNISKKMKKLFTFCFLESYRRKEYV